VLPVLVEHEKPIPQPQTIERTQPVQLLIAERRPGLMPPSLLPSRLMPPGSAQSGFGWGRLQVAGLAQHLAPVVRLIAQKCPAALRRIQLAQHRRQVLEHAAFLALQEFDEGAVEAGPTDERHDEQRQHHGDHLGQHDLRKKASHASHPAP
jgi:hypothetical protein